MNWHEQIDRAWNRDETRKRFEESTGFSSVDVDQKEFRQMVESGYYGLYVSAFGLWMTEELGIVDIAPTEIKKTLKSRTVTGEVSLAEVRKG